MRVSAKQDQIGQAIHDGKRTIVLIGAIGTSKTYGALAAMHSICIQYPGSRVLVGRRNLTEMRRTTLFMARDVAWDMGLRERVHYTEYKTPGNERFVFHTGDGEDVPDSQMMFIEADETRGTNRLKIDSTAMFLDEADDINFDAFLTLNSRVGRVNANGAPPFTILACNPNEAWIKDKYYNPYSEPGKHGGLAEDVAVVEFSMADSFLGDEYYGQFRDNPEQWKQRFLYNNWEYGDDLNSLFKYRHLDSAHVDRPTKGTRTIGSDPARSTDRSVVALWDNMQLVDIFMLKDTGEQMDYEEQAPDLKDYASGNGVGYANMAIDAVGEGQGLMTALKTLYKWYPEPYVANAEPDSKKELQEKLSHAHSVEEKHYIRRQNPVVYRDLRTELAVKLSQDIESGQVKFYEGCPYLKDFKKEATMHNTTENGRVFTLEPKEKVKERTGKSPDIFDAVLAGYWQQLRSQSFEGYGKSKGRGKHIQASPTAGIRPEKKKGTITGGIMDGKW